MPQATLQKLERAQIKQAALMLSRAFKDGMRELFPDEQERRRKEPAISEFHLRFSYSYSEPVITSPGLEGIAVWTRSDRLKKRTLWSILLSGCAPLAFRIGVKTIRTMNAHDAYTLQKHKELVPGRHWYLAALAVDPVHQGKGYASRLLKDGLRRIDAENLPCYLETDGEKNALMYRRFGFEVINEFVAPGSNEVTIAMLRKSRQA